MSTDETHDVEAIEEASEAISKEERRGSLSLWFGVLGGPLAWGGHLLANYSLEEWFACSPATEHKGEILGFSLDIVSIVINSVMLALAAGSGLVAYACWKKLRAQEGGDERLERARWMAFAGIVEASLFTGVILLGYLPVLTLGICETTP
jgi:hypothetical protein